MKKCYCCGADAPDESKFCPKCGKPMAVTRDLIDRAKAGDSDAQTELYERTYKTVYSRTRAKVPDADTVMDIMQETYRCAFTGLDQLQKAESFPSWVLTIANRQVCDWYKQNVQVSQPENENDDTTPDENDLPEIPEFPEDFSPDEPPDRAETGRLLSEILNTLPEDQRIILIMRCYDELSLQEISEDLSIDLSTVQSRLSAGKKNVEAKVLELEKSGTDLYSLSPIAFLVYLLHHAELFAPAIPANTVIGLAANGTADAGGTDADHVAADTAAETTAPAAAKRINLKVVAIIAAAVIVVGGGTTAAVIATNNAREASDTAATETSQDMLIGLIPDETTAEEDETDPGTSEKPVETDVPEEPSEKESDQQEPETAAEEEAQEEESTIQPPSEDTVHAMVDPFAHWYVWTANTPGKVITPTLNQAAELAACAYYFENGDFSGTFPADSDPFSWAYILPESGIEESLKNRFGSEFDLSAFTNTVSADGTGIFGSGFESALAPDENPLGLMLCKVNGQYKYTVLPTGGVTSPSGVTITGIEKSKTSADRYIAIVDYNWEYGYENGYNESSELYEFTNIEGIAEVEYELAFNENSAYGWVIKQITYRDSYETNRYESYSTMGGI